MRRCPCPPHPIRSLPPPRTQPLPFPFRFLHFIDLWQLQSPLVAAPAAAASRKARGGGGNGKARKLSKSSANSNHASCNVGGSTIEAVHNRRSKGKAKAVNSSSFRRGSVASIVGDGAAAQHSSDDESGDNDEVAGIFDVITMSNGARGYRCPQPGCGKLCSRLPDCKKHHRTFRIIWCFGNLFLVSRTNAMLTCHARDC